MQIRDKVVVLLEIRSHRFALESVRPGRFIEAVRLIFFTTNKIHYNNINNFSFFQSLGILEETNYLQFTKMHLKA